MLTAECFAVNLFFPEIAKRLYQRGRAASMMDSSEAS